MNVYNNKGEQHGPWEIYYLNGRLDWKGEYVNDNRHGLCESYWSNGNLHYKGEYRNGLKHGLWKCNDNFDKTEIYTEFFL